MTCTSCPARLERNALVVLLGTLGLILSGCGRDSAPDQDGQRADAQTATRSVTLPSGVSVAVPVEPRRVLVANTAQVDAAVDLLPADRLAAVCSQGFTWSWPLVQSPARFESVPTFDRFVVETVLARRPDLVLCSPFSRPETLKILRSTDLAVVELADPTDLASLRTWLTCLGDLFASRERANLVLRDLDQRVTVLRARAADRERRPRALFYSHSGGEGYASGDGTLAGEVLGLAGMVNALAERGTRGVARLTFEELIAIDPEIVVVPATFGEVDGSTRRVLEEHRALRTLRVRRGAGRILQLPPALFSTTSHHAITAAEQLAEQLDTPPESGR